MKEWEIRFFGYSESGRFEVKMIVKADDMEVAKQKASNNLQGLKLYHCVSKDLMRRMNEA